MKRDVKARLDHFKGCKLLDNSLAENRGSFFSFPGKCEREKEVLCQTEENKKRFCVKIMHRRCKIRKKDTLGYYLGKIIFCLFCDEIHNFAVPCAFPHFNFTGTNLSKKILFFKF